MARQYKLARKMKGVALIAVAKALGVTQPTFIGWVRERKAPSIEGLILMVKFYEVTTDFLFGADRRQRTVSRLDAADCPGDPTGSS